MNTKNGNRLPLIIFSILVSLLLLTIIPAANAQSTSLVTKRLQEYAKSYPDIYFLHLKGDKNNEGFNTLPKQLGEDADNMDYEHDTAARNDLLDLQFMRINYLQNNNMPSATLFKTGKDSNFKQPYVCVITVNESLFQNNPTASLQFMLGDPLPDELQGKNISAFDNNTFLQFTVDHEIYHCLDAYLHGNSISKTSDDNAAAYQHFLSEYRADLYASLVTRQSTPLAIEFLTLLASFRTMGLVDMDTEHYTASAIRQAIKTPVSNLNNFAKTVIAENTRELARDSQPGANEYGRLINAANGLALYVGIDSVDRDSGKKIRDDLHPSSHLRLIIQEFEGARAYLTSNLYPQDS